jgi:3-hydroxybutyryl-CoA dehydrogenase
MSASSHLVARRRRDHRASEFQAIKLSFRQENRQMEIRKVGVLGCGLMGSGIAQTAAAAGFDVIVREVSDELCERGFAGIDKSLSKFVEKGTMTAEQRAEVRGRLKGTTKFEDLADCDIIIEAIIENLETKRDTYGQLDKLCKPETIFASNTSSLSITEMLTATSPERQRRFIGLHFFNPVPVMKLVEVVRTILTDAEVYDQAVEFGKRLGKVPVRAGDRSGFIVNRLLVPYLLDAIRALEEGAGSIVDIDNGMKLGCGHPMGPLTLLDFVGLDTTYYISEIMFTEFRERRFAAPPLLKRMVMAGLYGRKTGRGFYDYADPKNPTPMSLV